MPNHEKDFLLIMHVFDLLQTNYFRDRQDFQRQIFLGLSVPDQNHTPECAGAYISTNTSLERRPHNRKIRSIWSSINQSINQNFLEWPISNLSYYKVH